MNLYIAVLIFTGLVAVALWLWGDCQRERADRAERECNAERAHAHDLALQLRTALRTLRRLRKQRDDDWAVVERMMEQMAHDERRMAYLDERRYSILIRWWRRAKYRHLLVAGRLIGRRNGLAGD